MGSTGSLQLVDEIVFSATPGLEVGALWIAAGASGSGTALDEVGDGALEEETDVLMLVPMHHAGQELHGDSELPSFGLTMEKVSSASARFIVSLQEALDRNLELSSDPARWAVPHSHGAAVHYPGLFSSPSTIRHWPALAASNQELLDHRLIFQLLNGKVRFSSRDASAVLQFLLQGNRPADIRKALTQDDLAIEEAILEWGKSQGRFKKQVPLSLPWQADDSALQSYAAAKQRQTELDILTVAFLYARRNHPLATSTP